MKKSHEQWFKESKGIPLWRYRAAVAGEGWPVGYEMNADKFNESIDRAGKGPIGSVPSKKGASK